MSTSTTPEPAALVLFGITGDLAHRKLLPAIYHLAVAGNLPEDFHIFGVTRRGAIVDELIASLRDRLQQDGVDTNEHQLQRLASAITIIKMDLDQPEGYAKLKQLLDEHEQRIGACINRLFYLSVPATAFGSIAEMLATNGLGGGCQHGAGEARLLIEKPFGHDLASAQRLIDVLHRHFNEQHIYRIDHYVAKEVAQSIGMLRANPALQALQEKAKPLGVIVSATEQISIEGRSTFYDQTGALRDLVQSHLLQLLALACMEPLRADDAESLHAAKLAVLGAIAPADPSQAVRGQYRGYKDEVQNADSFTETFAALRLKINTPYWRDVPVLIRTGKGLARKSIDITLVFADDDGARQTLTFATADEGAIVHLQNAGDAPSFEEHREGTEAYRRILRDALMGDKHLFLTDDEVLASWKVVQSLLDSWRRSSDGLEAYAKGTAGPDSAARLAADVGLNWPE